MMISVMWEVWEHREQLTPITQKKESLVSEGERKRRGLNCFSSRRGADGEGSRRRDTIRCLTVFFFSILFVKIEEGCETVETE
jgi:hypothetical protein